MSADSIRGLHGDGVTILIGGRAVRIDECDVDLVSRYSWSLLTTGSDHVYAVARKRILMHRLVTGAGVGFVVDHANNDGLDNRRSNLRVCSQSQNLHNRPGWRNSAVPFKGVTAAGKKFRAQIMCGGERHYLGVFATAKEAAEAYDRAAIRLHGAFAWVNFKGVFHAFHLA